MELKYKRVLLKLSGESLMGQQKYGIEPEMLNYFASEIKKIHSLGVEVGVVIGGGNIFRGLGGTEKGFDRVTGDHMGMLATMINSLALRNAVENAGIKAVVMSSIAMIPVAETFVQRDAIRLLGEGKVVIIGGGTGNPFFSTDTAASLRAVEIKADVIMKGTRVDGVYDSDPEKNPTATKYDNISYLDVISKDLRVMDHASISLCKDNNLPLLVFNMNKEDNLLKIVKGENIGTKVGWK